MRSFLQSTKSLNIDADSSLKRSELGYTISSSTSSMATIENLPHIIYDATNFIAVFAFYRKVKKYTGPLFTIRRGADNLEKTCYSTEEAIEFLNGGTGFVMAWYNQTGDGKYFIETFAAAQPTFISSDSQMFGAPSMDLSTNRGMTGNITNTNTNSHCYTIAFVTYTTGNRILAGSNNWLVGPYYGIYNVHAGSFSGGVSVQPNVMKIQSAYRLNNGGYFNRVNGVSLGVSAGTITAGTLNLGIRGNYSEPAGSRIAELLIKDDIRTIEDIAMVEGSANGRYRLW